MYQLHTAYQHLWLPYLKRAGEGCGNPSVSINVFGAPYGLIGQVHLSLLARWCGEKAQKSGDPTANPCLSKLLLLLFLTLVL